MENVRQYMTAGIGIVWGGVSVLVGGWDQGILTLLIMMAIDYITGLVVAGVFKKSGKSENGALESRAGFKGLCRKGVIILIVVIAVRLDLLLETDFIRNMTIIAFVVNEIISIVENVGLMGVPIPGVITRSIDILKSKTEGTKKDE